jgi:DNA topoisomerase-2
MTDVKQRKVKQISMREHIKNRSMWAGSKNSQSIESYVLVKRIDNNIGKDINNNTNTGKDTDTDKDTDKDTDTGKNNNKNTDTGKNTDLIFELQTTKYPPALYKIIDEIIVNAIDHHVEYPKHVTKITIDVSQDGSISVFNNGPGINIEKTKNLQGVEMHTPQLIFSEFLAGSNLDDNETKERIVGGQNGLGAKITAVFSTSFQIETTDEINKLFYKQIFIDGLETVGKPEILNIKTDKSLTTEQKKGHTRITFTPDYKEFGLNPTKFYPTLLKIVETRAWQASAYTGINVVFNNIPVPIKKFSDFCSMFSEFDIFPTIMNSAKQKQFPWEICIGITDGKERQLSMINGVFIPAGGTHIKYIQNTLVDHLKDKIEKELKKAKVKFNKNILLNNLFIFMKGSIPNPEFLSQTKDAISTPIERFTGYEIPEAHWTKLWKFVEPVVMASFLKKQLGDVRLRANRGKVDVPKYKEANYARIAKKCHECGLIITEGDSASGTANTGLLSKASDRFNYDYFGVYGIQGVMVNALKESLEMKNKEKAKANDKPKTNSSN